VPITVQFSLKLDILYFKREEKGEREREKKVEEEEEEEEEEDEKRVKVGRQMDKGKKTKHYFYEV
jgi:hypothetical protein